MKSIQEDYLEQRPGTSVTVELDWNALEPSIEVMLEIGPETAGGDFEAWAEGAVYGVRFALESSNALPCAACIRQILGDFETTNATIVAAAAAHAIWEAIDFEPQPDVIARIEGAVQRSRQGPQDGAVVPFES
ncbi:MAG: hypothetical protein E2O39_07860 [Planctomycetota bacterium]|nr:MAG: hypothetical protein E2O39_07860 [Planctomycetota bacterium]